MTIYVVSQHDGDLVSHILACVVTEHIDVFYPGRLAALIRNHLLLPVVCVDVAGVIIVNIVGIVEESYLSMSQMGK